MIVFGLILGDSAALSVYGTFINRPQFPAKVTKFQIQDKFRTQLVPGQVAEIKNSRRKSITYCHLCTRQNRLPFSW